MSKETKDLNNLSEKEQLKEVKQDSHSIQLVYQESPLKKKSSREAYRKSLEKQDS